MQIQSNYIILNYAFEMHSDWKNNSYFVGSKKNYAQ